MSENCGIEFSTIDPSPFQCLPDNAQFLISVPGNYYLESWSKIKACLGVITPDPSLVGTWGAPNETLVTTVDQYGNITAISAVPIAIDFGQVSNIPNVNLVGDITGSGPLGSNISTLLANTGIVAGVYGSATQSASIEFDAKGRALSAQNVPINIPFSQISDGPAAVNNLIQIQKGVANGITPLGPDGKIDTIYLPDSILGNVRYKGTYNGTIITSSDPALNGQPLPPAAPANAGYYFIATAPFTNGGVGYAIGDWIISDGANWSRVENSDAVTSVFGRVGNIIAVAGDYNTDLVTELGGATNLYFTTARARNSISATSGVSYDPLTGVITHGATSPMGAGSLTLSGPNVFSSLSFDAFGHLTDVQSRALTAGDIGAAATSHTHTATFTSDITGSGIITGSIALSITDGAVTYSKIQNVTSKRLLGRFATTNGVVQEISLGPSLVLGDDGILGTAVGGSVTSVGLSLPSGVFNISGSPVTSTGTLTGTLLAQDARKVFIGPNGGAAAAPTFRLLVEADIPTLSAYALKTTTVTTTGFGIAGGGDLSSNRTFNLDFSYLDDRYLSGYKQRGAVRVATTGNITLSGLQTIDGVSLVAGNRVLAKNQTAGADNGIYVVAAGAWSRAADFDQAESGEIEQGAQIFVEEGTTQAKTGWSLSTPSPITVGSTVLTFIQYAGANSYSNGTGLNLVGNVFSAQTTNAIWNANSLQGITISASAPANTNVLRYNGTAWAPYALTKADVGLANVDNTADIDKPISTLTQAALDGKVPTTRSITIVGTAPISSSSGAQNLSADRTWTISLNDNGVTYAKMQDVTASRLLGRYAATAGDPQEITVGAGLTLSTGGVLTAAGSGGTVTSVDVDMPSIFSVAGSPITTSGTIAVTLLSQLANTVFAAPNGSAGVPTFRVLSAADIPTITASKISDFTAVVRTSISQGTGITYNSSTGVITNNDPDQTVVLNPGTGIQITGAYPNFTITNTLPNVTPNLQQVLTVGNISSSSNIIFNAAALGISWNNGANNRWLLRQDTFPNSDFSLYKYDDAGVSATVLRANRSTGIVDFSITPTRAGNAIWDANNHIIGAAFTPTLTGANVPASFASNAAGHVTAFTTRVLTPADIGAAVATGSGNYIQSQISGVQSSSNFWISGVGRTSNNFQVTKDGANSFQQTVWLMNSATTAGANIQLNGDANPGLATWIHDGSAYQKRMEIFATGTTQFYSNVTMSNAAATLNVAGQVAIGTVPALGTAATTYLTTNAGTVSSRTAAQVLSDIGAAPASASANYIQNQVAGPQTANFHISGNGRANNQFIVSKDGSNSANAHFQLYNAAATRGATLQLNADATPGLSIWLHNGSSWVERQRISATDGTTNVYGRLLGATTSGVRGSGVGISNTAFYGFYESDGNTRQGYVGKGSGSTDHIYMVSDNGGIVLAPIAGEGVTITQIPAQVAAASHFLTSLAGVIQYRTTAQVLSDIGAAPSSGSGSYIQNSATLQSSSNFWISGQGVTNGSYQTRKTGVNTIDGTIVLYNPGATRGVNFQLNGDADPGLAVWVNSAGTWNKRMEIFSNGLAQFYGNVTMSNAAATATIAGQVNIGTIPALGTAATTFLTTNSGVVSSRTAAQVRSDIGAGTGNGSVISVGLASTDLSISGSPITTTGNITVNINNNAVTYAKMQDVNASRLLGRYTASVGDPQEISIGSGLNLSVGGVLSATSTAAAATTSMFIQSANKVVSNTTFSTTLVGVGSGTTTVAASTFETGENYHVKIRGTITSMGASPGTIRLFLNFGSASASCSAITLSAGLNKVFEFVGDITCRTSGAAGTVLISGFFRMAQNSLSSFVTAESIPVVLALEPATVDTTIANAIDFRAQFSVADASNTITSKIFVITKETTGTVP